MNPDYFEDSWCNLDRKKELSFGGRMQVTKEEAMAYRSKGKPLVFEGILITNMRARAYLLMKRIYEEGVISKQRYNELALEVGYKDLRGPQAMFKGGGKYVTLIAGNQVATTPKGVQRLKDKGLI